MRAKKTKNIETIVASKDTERVKAEIHAKYGFWVTNEYARDLIAFVDAMTREMAS